EAQRPAFVSSFGTLSYFTRSNAPPESAERCVDCPLRDTCLYSATRFYVHERRGWPFDVIAPVTASAEERHHAIATGPYGRCVWKCGNDGCDNQSVTVQFESGAHAWFGLYGLTSDNTRRVTVLMDRAELNGDLHRGHLTIAPFTGTTAAPAPREIPIEAADDYHGGGDAALLRALHEHLTTGVHQE